MIEFAYLYILSFLQCNMDGLFKICLVFFLGWMEYNSTFLEPPGWEGRDTEGVMNR